MRGLRAQCSRHGTVGGPTASLCIFLTALSGLSLDPCSVLPSTWEDPPSPCCQEMGLRCTLSFRRQAQGCPRLSWGAAELATPVSAACRSVGMWAPHCGTLAGSAYTQAATLDLRQAGGCHLRQAGGCHLHEKPLGSHQVLPWSECAPPGVGKILICSATSAKC